MENTLRLRAPNYTRSDNMLLCDIVKKHKNIIESNGTDRANLLRIQKAWFEVAQEYNSINNGYSRTKESLQLNYKNLKKKIKKYSPVAKMDIADDDALLKKVHELVGPSSDEVHTVNGSDSGLMASQSDVILNEAVNENDSSAIGEETTQPLNQPTQDDINLQYSNNDRANLTISPSHSANQTSDKVSEELEKLTLPEKLNVLASENIKLIVAQKEILRLQILEEKDVVNHKHTLRAMEIEELKRKYEYNGALRKLKLEKFDYAKKTNFDFPNLRFQNDNHELYVK